MTQPAPEASSVEPGKPGSTTVFGYVDQQVMVSRIDTVDDDDLASSFFGDSIQDVAQAATKMFDVGVRDDGVHGEEAAPSSFGVPVGPKHAADESSNAPAAAVDGEATRREDAARHAFILGGPAAMKQD